MATTLESAANAANISFNFNYKGRQPNFARDKFSDTAEMYAYQICDVGHISYVLSENKYYKFTGKGLGWEELVLGGDTSQLEADIEEIQQRIAGFNAKEVFQVDELPTASEDTTDKMYLIPVIGQDYFEEYITTKKRKSTIDNHELTDIAEAFGSTDFLPLFSNRDAWIAAADTYNYCLYQDYFCVYGEEDEDADSWDETDSTNHFGWNQYVISTGSIVYGRNPDRTAIDKIVYYKATSEGWVAATDAEVYEYVWLQVGSTQWNVDEKQDKLTNSNGNIIVKVNGVDYVLTGAVAIQKPTAPTISQAGGSVDSTLGSNVTVTVQNNASNGITYYKTANSAADAENVSNEDYTGSTSGQATVTLKSTTDKNATYDKYLCAVSYQFGVASDKTAVQHYAIKQKLQTPVITVDGTDYNTTRTPKITVPSPTSTLSGLSVTYTVNGITQTENISGSTLNLDNLNSDNSSITRVYLEKADYISSEKASKTGIRVNRPKIYYGLLNTDPETIRATEASFIEYIKSIEPVEGDTWISSTTSIAKETSGGLEVEFTVSSDYGSNNHWMMIAIPTGDGSPDLRKVSSLVDATSIFKENAFSEGDYSVYYALLEGDSSVIYNFYVNE